MNNKKKESEVSTLILVGGYIRKYTSFLAPIYDYLSETFVNYNLKHSILPLIKKLKNKNLKVIALDPISSEKLKRHDVDHGNFKEYLSIEGDKKVQEDSVKFIREFYSKNKIFKQLSNYKNISLWGANELDIWQSFFYRIFKRADMLNNIIKTNNPSTIVIHSFDIYQEILEQIARKKGIKVISKIPFNSRLKDKAYTKLLPIGISLLRTELDNFPRFRKEKEDISSKKAQKKPKILFITNDNMIDEPTSYMVNKLSSESKYVKIISTYDLSKICRKKGINFSQFSDYYTKKIINDLKIANKNIKNNFTKMKKFLNSRKLSYRGIAINEYLKEMFYFLYLKRYPESTVLIELVEEMIAAENPDIIMIRDDVHYLGRIISLVARKLKVPTLVIQHGFLLDHALRGLYADYIAVYGDKTKKVYTKRNTKSDNVLIVGNTNFDILYNKKFDDKGTKRTFGIPSNKKNLLYATASGKLNFQHTKLVISAVSELENTNLIIKLHHGDSNSIGYYRSLLKKMDCIGTVIRDYGIFPLLHLCDVLIMWQSTTGLEAVVFGKPIINLGFGDNLGDFFHINAGYCEEGVAIPVTDKESLKKTIGHCLYDKKLREKLSKNRKKYIKRNLFKIDGKAVLRVDRCIDKIISSRR